MSKIEIASITCGKCGSPFDAEIYGSVNVTVDPGLRKRVLDKKINSFRCPSCGFINDFIYPFLYVDMEKKLQIWCYPESLTDQINENKKAVAQLELISRAIGTPETEYVVGYDELLKRI